MLEITFSESLAGNLMAAMGRKRGDMITSDGAIAVICDDPNEREQLLREMNMPRAWTGGEISGTPRDVMSLHLQLDYGDISHMDEGIGSRFLSLQELYGHYNGVVEELLANAQRTLKQILSACEMRLWVGAEDPCDLCAACWLCHILRDSPVKILMVYLPAYVQKSDALCSYSGAANMKPEEISRYVTDAVELTAGTRKHMGARWIELAKENAPMRVVLNGKIMGAPIDVYDWALRSEIPEGEWKLGIPISRTLMKTRAVGDVILYAVIRRWLAQDILETVTPAKDENPYSAVCKKGSNWKKHHIVR